MTQHDSHDPSPVISAFSSGSKPWRWARTWLPSALMLGLAVACGGGESENANKGSGGGSGTGAVGIGGSGATGSGGEGTGGDTTTGGSSSGGTGGVFMSDRPGYPYDLDPATAPDSLRYACIAYVGAVCLRFAECGSADVTSCIQGNSLACPGLIFGEGSTRTREGTLACAQDWLDFSCEDVAAGKDPACTTSGSRMGGEPCMWDPQCASFECSPTPGSCGHCTAVATGDGTCEQGVTGCPRGQVCSGTTCIPIQRSVPTGMSVTRHLGDPCDAQFLCLKGLACENGTCVEGSGLNEPCSLSTDCGQGLSCTSSVCTPQAEPGADCSELAVCGPGEYCNGTNCTPFVAPGGECTVAAACGPDMACTCRDDACTGASTKYCLTPREEGESCGGDEKCNQGLVCTAGTCMATDDMSAVEACDALDP